MKRRILSIFMCLCMTLCLLPTAALADGATKYDVWVGGVRVTSANAGDVLGDGTVNYDAQSGMLTLNSANITGTYSDGSGVGAAIYAGADLTIRLIGGSTALGPATASSCSFGVYGTDALNITGSGSLTATGGKATNGNSYGMNGGGGITISDSAQVTATGGEATNGKGYGVNGDSYGVNGGGNVTISDSAQVTATGGKAANMSCGMNGDSYGVNGGGSITISDSAQVTATGGKAANMSCGVIGSITVSDCAKVTATGGRLMNNNGGSLGVYSNSIAISGGTVTATGGQADNNGSRSLGVYSNRIAISGGMVTATGGIADKMSYGVSGNNIAISGGTVTATGSETYNSDDSYGVNGVIDVNNGDGAANDGLIIAMGVTSAANVAPTCGVSSAALTGSGSAKFAVWGVSETYTVLNSTLDLSNNTTTSDWSDSANSRGWKWEYNAVGISTLTLKNVIINASDVTDSDAYGIKLPYEAVNIVLEGVNVVSAVESSNWSNGSSYGVYSNAKSGSIAISGSGALYTLSGMASMKGCKSSGVYSDGDITLSSTVTAVGAPGPSSYGVFSSGGNVTLSSGTVTAVSGMASVESCGVAGSGVTISGGNVTAVGSSTNTGSYGVFSSGGNVTLSSGTVTAVGGSSGTVSYGVGGNGGVTISGTVTAVGGSSGASSYGVYGGGDISISGTVAAVGSATNGESIGMYGKNSVTFNSGTVTATGGSAGKTSCGVCGKAVAIFGGIVAATGGSYGVGGSGVIISGGTTTAAGSSQAMQQAPDLTGYTSAHTITVSTSTDGSGAGTWDNETALTTYKYLKITPAALYALAVSLNGGSGTTVGGSYMAGDVIPIDAGTKPGYTFSGWTATGSGTFANASSAATTYTMPAGAAAITANWTANSSGGGEGGTSTTTVPVSGGSGAVNLSASVSGSTATVSATDAQLQKITSGTETGTVKIDASDLKADTVVVPSKLVTAAVDASGSAGLEVALPSGTVTLNKAALASIVGKGDVKLSIETVDNSKLTDTQKAALGSQAGSATVVDVNVYADGSRVSTFGNGTLQVSVPYIPKSGENKDSITVWFVGEDGTIEPKNGVYNAATGCVEFTTEHLSQYLIVSFPFADVAENSWYYGSVAYAYNNGLFAGTSDTSFSPDTAMTRQMIWMVLARMDGKTPADMDAARTWAMENGISDGSNPTDSITREQMATILYRYAQYKSYDVSIGEETNILSFQDALTINEYAIPAVQWACGAGLMQGSNNNIMPSGSATRAQVATILQRFCQNVVK